MGADILAFIQFDDNTPPGQAPFRNEGSLWSLRWDYGLYGCKDYAFIGAISGLRNASGTNALFPLRGPPASQAPPLREIADEPFVGWLNPSELHRCLAHQGIVLETLNPSVQTVIAVLDLLAQKYGDEKVRFIFSISD